MLFLNVSGMIFNVASRVWNDFQCYSFTCVWDDLRSEVGEAAPLEPGISAT